MTIQQALEIGMEHQRAGRLAQAESVYREILAQYPQNADTLHLLGVLASQTGRPAVAEDLIRQAIALAPQPIYLNNLGQLLQQTGRAADAEQCFRQSLKLQPHSADVWFFLASALDAQGRHAAASDAYLQCARLHPRQPEILNNLGNVFRSLGRPADAEQCFRHALQIKPDMLEANCNLGAFYESQARYREALPLYQRALAVDPKHPTVHYNMGVSLAALGRMEEAIRYYRQALQLKPDYFEVYNNLANVLKNIGRFDEAIAAYRAALRIKPDIVEALGNLGTILNDLARHDEGLAVYRQAFAVQRGNPLLHSNYVYALVFHPQFDAPTIQQELTLFNQRHIEPLRSALQPHPNDRHPERRLRIGFVSPDFRDHVVGRNILALFQHRDRAAGEFFCYSNLVVADALTGTFRQLADHWRDIPAVPPQNVAEQIRQDGIDILVDLALHMAGTSLMVFARKPAPVQVTFAGYPGSTGVETIDYRLSDPYLDPPEHDSLYSEKTIRLPHSFWCYATVADDVPTNPLPALSTGAVTFGCLNNFGKTNLATFDLWSKILQAIDRSRLFLLCPEGSHRQAALDFFQSRGIGPDRILFFAHHPRREYLQLYHQIDIGLDTLPYNGHTTSLDALWMGVPVVTLVGKTVVGRAGYSQLMNLNLPELITTTPDAYIATVTALARDLPRLQGLRAALRPRMQQSPLMDAPAFARAFEAALRQMWRTWCRSSTP
jgi:protein O-GlcNAc transferase